ncbi:KilA-N domain-containing protein [Myxococcus sp. K38C18041901]|uniref:KilA-N domain-containing protein n=1 Tax=Myxococcus guangdongensis TaxID=2906760 RepID=UPI0020A6EE5A|nr:KilA-N domain-containing protein [Myxococcus guangdongensis]MCP3065851.1 KilA-N domain-containing protein [Myxococcus guangdongensis]
MSCPSQQLTIGDVVVQQDAHGRYSLNDLHRAAGGEPRHQPSNFLRNESTRGLITELTRSSDSMNGPVESVRGGTAQGTFVSRPLVYAYAMWVSPAFHLRVIEVFDAVARGLPVPGAAPSFAVPKSLPEALRLAADLAEANERQAAQLVEQQRQLEAQSPAVKLADDFLSTTRLMSLMDTARHLRLPIRDFFRWLERDGVCFRKDSDGPWVPYASFIRDGRLVYQVRVLRQPKPGQDEPHTRPQTLVTPAGVAWFAKRYGHLAVPRPPEQVPLLPADAGTA